MRRLAVIAIALLACASAYAGRDGFARQWIGIVSAQWTPAQLPGLMLWLDASDAGTLWADTEATTAATNGGLVARWDDKSGSNRYATQSTSGSRPTLSGDKLVFDGSRLLNVQNALSMTRNKPATTIATANRYTDRTGVQLAFGASTGTGAFRSVIGQESSSGRSGGRRIDEGRYRRNERAIPDGVMQIVVLDQYWSGGESSWAEYINSVAVSDWVNGPGDDNGSGNSSDTDSTWVNVGAGNATFRFRGEMHCIIVTDAQLSAADRQRLEGWIAHRYGLTASLPANHPYKLRPPAK